MFENVGNKSLSFSRLSLLSHRSRLFDLFLLPTVDRLNDRLRELRLYCLLWKFLSLLLLRELNRRLKFGGESRRRGDILRGDRDGDRSGDLLGDHRRGELYRREYGDGDLIGLRPGLLYGMNGDAALICGDLPRCCGEFSCPIDLFSDC